MKLFSSFHRATFFWGIPALLWQVFFFYLPLTYLALTSFVHYVPELHAFHFTFSHYRHFLQWTYLAVVARSLAFACLTVCITLIIAYPTAYYLVVKISKRWSNLCFSLLVLPFWTNFLLLVYAWYFLLENNGLLNTLLLRSGLITEPLHIMNTQWAVACGMIYCYLPFMLLPLYTTFERFDKRLIEASKDLGATSWQTMREVTIPLTFSGIKTGALLVFIPSFGEFVIPALLGGDKTIYIGTVITHYFLTIQDVCAGSAFTCATTVLLLLFLAFVYYVWKLIIGRKRHD